MAKEFLTKEQKEYFKAFDYTPFSTERAINLFPDDNAYYPILKALGLEDADFEDGVSLVVVGYKENKHK